MTFAIEGRKKIEWANKSMPVLEEIRREFEIKKPFSGLTVGACLHVTAETANLLRTIEKGGATVYLCASNPLSTQDDVASALNSYYNINVFAKNGASKNLYYKHINKVLSYCPHVIIDDGADLISVLHSEYSDKCCDIFGAMEETTTGVTRLRSMERSGELKIPIIAVNDAKVKHLFDNRYGTGQSTLDGIIRATNCLIAGKKVVVAGYGWCGRGFAFRARGLGANVIVTEVDSIKAIEAVMDGFLVMPMIEAAKIGDIFCTLTGNINVIHREIFDNLKDGAILCNSGHFNVEIDLDTLKSMSKKVYKNVKKNIDQYVLRDGRSIYVLVEGRLVNLAAADGHPASVMDMSFSAQALCCEYVASSRDLQNKVYSVPDEIDTRIASMKLKSMGVHIDILSREQKEYLESWKLGT